MPHLNTAHVAYWSTKNCNDRNRTRGRNLEHDSKEITNCVRDYINVTSPSDITGERERPDSYQY